MHVVSLDLLGWLCLVVALFWALLHLMRPSLTRCYYCGQVLHPGQPVLRHMDAGWVAHQECHEKYRNA